jgi:hypothetical protein
VPPPSHLTSCTPTKSHLYFDTSSATLLSEPALYTLLTFQVPNLKSIFLRLGPLSEESVHVWGFLWIFVNRLIFYGEELLAPHPTPKLEDHPLSAVRDCLIQYIRSYPPYLEDGLPTKKIYRQTGRTFKTRCKHIHAIRTNNGNSGYSNHILNTGHAYGSITNTMKVLKTEKKGKHLNTLEKYHIHRHPEADIWSNTRIKRQEKRKKKTL